MRPLADASSVPPCALLQLLGAEHQRLPGAQVAGRLPRAGPARAGGLAHWRPCAKVGARNCAAVEKAGRHCPVPAISLVSASHARLHTGRTKVRLCLRPLRVHGIAHCCLIGPAPLLPSFFLPSNRHPPPLPCSPPLPSTRRWARCSTATTSWYPRPTRTSCRC